MDMAKLTLRGIGQDFSIKKLRNFSFIHKFQKFKKSKMFKVRQMYGIWIMISERAEKLIL